MLPLWCNYRPMRGGGGGGVTGAPDHYQGKRAPGDEDNINIYININNTIEFMQNFGQTCLRIRVLIHPRINKTKVVFISDCISRTRTRLCASCLVPGEN